MKNHIVGIDECNLGPSLSCDCVVCAYYRTGKKVEGVKDSKKVPFKKRIALFEPLTKEGIFYIVPATPNTITRIHTYLARNIAIVSAIMGIVTVIRYMEIEEPTGIVIDGQWSKEWTDRFGEIGYRVRGEAKADDTIYEVSAASIIARVYCDALFQGWETFFPDWGIGYDHGSITEKHKAEFLEKGPSPVHRTGIYANEWWKRLLTEEKYKEVFDG